jgi:glycerol-3-phosphate acyltransferase PlsY
MTMSDLSLILGAYFLGSVPFAFIVVYVKKGVDIRTIGSGNVGATNVGRALGRGWGIFVFTLDVLKGFAPVAVAQLIHGRGLGGQGLPLAIILTGLAAIVGHNWSIFLGFKGGKGVATSSGVFLAIFPIGLALSLAIWAVVVKLTRYISLGSMIGAVALLLFAILLRDNPFGAGRWLTAFAALSAAMNIARHHTNIRRLIAGTEGKVGEKQ